MPFKSGDENRNYIRQQTRVKVRVLSTEEPRGKDVARELYEVLPD